MPTWPRVTRRASSKATAFGLFGFAVANVVLAVVGTAWVGYDFDETVRTFVFPQTVIGLSCAVGGGLIAWQRPRNPVGWLVLSAGCLQTATAATVPWLDLGAQFGWPQTALRTLATIYSYSWPWGISLCIPMALLLFPDGALPSPRWRPVAWLVVADSLLFVTALGGEGAEPAAPIAHAWLVVPNYSDLAPLWLAIKISNAAVNVVALASLVIRYRRGTRRLRQQLRWLLLAVFFSAAAVVPQPLFGAGPILLFLALALIPLAMMFAVLRYRLLDIDLVIRRSLVYGVLSIGVATVYFGLAAAPGLTLGNQIPVEWAVLLTIIAAAAFQPLRRRLNSLADRWVFGQRVNRYQLLTTFGARLEQTVELGDLLPRLADTVHRGLGANWVRVTLPGASAVAGEPSGDALLRVPLERGGEVVGHLECGQKNGGYEPGDRELLDTLAGQAATAIANVQLTAQLAEQVAELARSRARIVAAQDTERRRIERNIHDGAQQHVVALIMKLRLARNQLGRGERTFDELLDELRSDTRDLLTDLRELAHGIHPPVLSDRGLVAAVEAKTDRLPLDVIVHADPALRAARLDAEIEGAAYFVICEALTNIVKHSAASAAGVDMSTQDGRLTVLVHDNGIGLSPAAGNGQGLTNLRDRVEALGGRLRVASEPGAGTSVHAELPIGAGDG
jgi:signal transduction histidine kinase